MRGALGPAQLVKFRFPLQVRNWHLAAVLVRGVLSLMLLDKFAICSNPSNVEDMVGRRSWNIAGVPAELAVVFP
jgi:hypothetical protein